MKYDENRRVLLETAFIRLASPETNFTETAVMARLKKLEEEKGQISYVRVPDKDAITENAKQSASESNDKKDEKIKELVLSPATFEDANKIKENWISILSEISRTKKTIFAKAKLIPIYDVLINDEKLGEFVEQLSNSAKKLINKNVEFRVVAEKDSKYSTEVMWKKEDVYAKIDGVIEEA